MKTVWKFALPGYGGPLSMPEGARVLHVAAQDDTPCLWAEVDSDSPPVERRFFPVGTGHLLPPGEVMFVGTTLLYSATLVLHWYELRG